MNEKPFSNLTSTTKFFQEKINPRQLGETLTVLGFQFAVTVFGTKAHGFFDLSIASQYQKTLNGPLLDESNLSFLLRFLSPDASLELLGSCPNKKYITTSPGSTKTFSHDQGQLCWAHSIDSVLLMFSHSVVSDSLGPHGLQHARLPCPSPSPRACSNSCPSSQ